MWSWPEVTTQPSDPAFPRGARPRMSGRERATRFYPAGQPVTLMEHKNQKKCRTSAHRGLLPSKRNASERGFYPGTPSVHPTIWGRLSLQLSVLVLQSQDFRKLPSAEPKEANSGKVAIKTLSPLLRCQRCNFSCFMSCISFYHRSFLDLSFTSHASLP